MKDLAKVFKIDETSLFSKIIEILIDLVLSDNSATNVQERLEKIHSEFVTVDFSV